MAVLQQPPPPAPAVAGAGDREAAWLLEQEALALLTRLRRVRPFALQETMLPAAALSPSAQVGIDTLLAGGRRELRRQVIAFLDWVGGPRARPRPAHVARFLP